MDVLVWRSLRIGLGGDVDLGLRVIESIRKDVFVRESEVRRG